MSKGININDMFVDARLLRDNVSKLRAEKKLAVRLRDSVMAMRNSSDGTSYGEYHSVLRDVDQLIDYLERMARLLSEAEDQAEQISHEAANQIEENTIKTKHISSQSFML